ncbi:hypothetical protein, partial [Flavobacterium sp. YO64]|uniref:hypothetical protein n=1 Tax=Flavobacterium sp. YO64 TaxID=394559 RepID=UPI0010286878
SISEDSTAKVSNNKIREVYPINVVVKKGNTYINDEEKIVIAVNDIDVYGKCNLVLSIGNNKNEDYKNVKVGKIFTYSIKNRKLNVTLSKTDFISSNATFHITKEN